MKALRVVATIKICKTGAAFIASSIFFVQTNNNSFEKKKINAGFQAYLDKQKAKKGGKDDKKGGKGKPDFLDLDKDGDKKETMKKAAKDAKEDDKGTDKKGLTAGQKKLPEAMQKAILKKQGK